jgi:hypothetical protein
MKRTRSTKKAAHGTRRAARHADPQPLGAERSAPLTISPSAHALDFRLWSKPTCPAAVGWLRFLGRGN